MAFNYTDYYALEYIDSSGTQYIDTGLNDVNGYEYSGVIQLLSGNSGTLYALGRTQSYHNEALSFNATSLKFAVNIGSKSENIDLAVSLNTNISFWVDARVSYTRYGRIDDTTSNTITNTNNIVNINSYIFARNIINSGPGGYSKMRLKWLDVYDNDGLIVASFAPAMRKSDNAVGLYDMIREAWYPNAGTGVFVAGPIIPSPYGTNVVKLKVNGTWKDATPHIKVNGSWKEATPYIKVNGAWKETVS